MSGGFPIFGEINRPQSSAASFYGTQLTTGIANTKAAWTQLIASTSGDISTIGVELLTGSAIVSLVDIGIGASGFEMPIILNIPYVVRGSTGLYTNFKFPINILSGSRIAARAQSNTGNSPLCIVQGYDGDLTSLDGYAIMDGTLGAGATSLVSAVPNAVATTKGTFTQLTASTTADYMAVHVSLFSDVNINAMAWATDIAIGSAGSEKVIIPNLPLYTGGVDNPSPAFGDTFNISIPSGTRVAARCSSVTSTTAGISVGVQGIK